MIDTYSKKELELVIGSLAGEICSLPEKDIGFSNCKVKELHNCMQKYEERYGASINLLVMRSEFCFEDYEQRDFFLKRAEILASQKSELDQKYVADARVEFEQEKKN